MSDEFQFNGNEDDLMAVAAEHNAMIGTRQAVPPTPENPSGGPQFAPNLVLIRHCADEGHFHLSIGGAVPVDPRDPEMNPVHIILDTQEMLRQLGMGSLLQVGTATSLLMAGVPLADVERIAPPGSLALLVEQDMVDPENGALTDLGRWAYRRLMGHEQEGDDDFTP